MSYRVRLSEDAKNDLEIRFRTLAERSPQNAERLNKSFEKALLWLRDFPTSCGLAHENSSFTVEVRHLLFGVHPKRRYRALFVVRGDEVVIIAIRAPGEASTTPEDLKPEA